MQEVLWFRQICC